MMYDMESLSVSAKRAFVWQHQKLRQLISTYSTRHAPTKSTTRRRKPRRGLGRQTPHNCRGCFVHGKAVLQRQCHVLGRTGWGAGWILRGRRGAFAGLSPGTPSTGGCCGSRRHSPPARRDAAGQRDRAGARSLGARGIGQVDRAQECPQEAPFFAVDVRAADPAGDQQPASVGPDAGRARARLSCPREG